MAPATGRRAWLQSSVQLWRCSHCRDNLEGIKLRPLRHPQRLLSPSDFQRNLEGGSVWHPEALVLSQWPRQLVQQPLRKCADWTRRLHRNVEANHVLLAGEICRDKSSHSATIAPLRAAVQPADSTRHPEAKTPPPSLRRSPSKGRLSFPEHRGKELV